MAGGILLVLVLVVVLVLDSVDEMCRCGVCFGLRHGREPSEKIFEDEDDDEDEYDSRLRAQSLLRPKGSVQGLHKTRKSFSGKIVRTRKQFTSGATPRANR
jgi:hypothetical protein